MNTQLLSAFNTLEDQRQLLIRLLENTPHEKMFSAPTGKWSVAQILTHLLTSEKLSVGYMKKKSLGIEALQDSGMKQVLLLEILKVSQRIPFRYKAPRVVVENTPEALPLPELIRQWDEVRNNLRAFLQRMESRHQKRLIFKHPIAGKFNAEQAVVFLYEHVNHHLPQIKRLLASA